jgi:hypothetical protein
VPSALKKPTSKSTESRKKCEQGRRGALGKGETWREER